MIVQLGIVTCVFIPVSRYSESTDIGKKWYNCKKNNLTINLNHTLYTIILEIFFIFSGEKPYPCQFCGRRFRTNYNKLGHEKKCPDRHAQDLANTQTNVNSSKTNEHNSEPPQKIMLNLNNQAVPVLPSAGGGRTSSISGSQTNAPPAPTAQTAEYR